MSDTVLDKAKQRVQQLADMMGGRDDDWTATAKPETKKDTGEKLNPTAEDLRHYEEQRKWSAKLRQMEEEDRQYAESIIGTDPAIDKLEQAVGVVESEYGRLQVALIDIRSQLAKLDQKVKIDLSEVSLEELSKATTAARVRAEADAIEKNALSTAEREISRRFGECEARLNEAKTTFKRARRAVLHRYCDQLIKQACPQIEALNMAILEIRRVERLIREHGGVRQGFANPQLTSMIENYVEWMSRDVADIVTFSEDYERLS